MQTLKDIYRAGRDRGLSFGQYAVEELQLGDQIKVVGLIEPYAGTLTDPNELEEKRIEKAYECESANRDYSPFEFTAHKLNSFGYSGDNGDEDRPFYAEDAWEAFDDGISKGIDIAIYLDRRKQRKA